MTPQVFKFSHLEIFKIYSISTLLPYSLFEFNKQNNDDNYIYLTPVNLQILLDELIEYPEMYDLIDRIIKQDKNDVIPEYISYGIQQPII